MIVACAAFAVLCPGERDDVQALDGAFRARPVIALVFGLAMLSLAGIPPLPGFFAKLFVFTSVVRRAIWRPPRWRSSEALSA